MRRCVWLLLLALACCTQPAPTVQTAAPKVCRLGPDGARPADIADRGIGGTGAPATQVTDRGIGGTGIIGVITGFGSVCVAGEEVALPPAVPLSIDDGPATPDDLRAGQVVAMAASGPPSALLAQQVVVRHAVIGPVQAVGPGTMTVAGQVVGTAGALGPAVKAQPGQWVAVSGLSDGSVITATRIDPALPGQVLVRGELVRSYGAARVGSQPVVLPDSVTPPAGWPVVVTGRLVNGVLIADTVTRDLASESPSAYFGPSIDSFVIEADIAAVTGGYRINRDFVRGSGLAPLGASGRGVVRFERGPGGLVATGLQFGDARRTGGFGFGQEGGFSRRLDRGVGLPGFGPPGSDASGFVGPGGGPSFGPERPFGAPGGGGPGRR